MNIIADTHLHFYTCYDLKRALGVLRSNLTALGPDSLQMAFLAERHDCHFFKEIKDRKKEVTTSALQVSDFGEALLLGEEGYNDLYLFAGRQVITSERLEVLALTTDVDIPDGLPVEDVIERVNREGAIAVLSWAPGKWFAQRGKKVARLLSEYTAQDLVLGDTTLRPWCWLEPLLMKKGIKSGFSVLAGSDPLPFAGEEEMMGRYVSSWQMELDEESPVASVRNYLRESVRRPERIGSRGLCLETLMRLYKNFKTK